MLLISFVVFSAFLFYFIKLFTVGSIPGIGKWTVFGVATCTVSCFVIPHTMGMLHAAVCPHSALYNVVSCNNGVFAGKTTVI